MRIAFLADVHSNLEAFTACLADAERLGAGRFVFLGDLVGYGADPRGVLERVIELIAERGAVAVRGNHEVAVTSSPRPEMNEDARTSLIWTRSVLPREHLEFLEKLPLAVEDDGRLYVHANAWAPEGWEYIHDTGAAERSLRATVCRLTVCGHVHRPALYQMGSESSARASLFQPVPGVAIPLSPLRRWLAIPGSAGQPRDGDPSACYGVLDDAAGTLTFLRVPYDHETAARKVREAGLPASRRAPMEAGL
jgi:diadenosine tetraphosphatase ApaH/serine/threonine PP2A family protein phosphatase